jgi:aminoglycoside phosphotransferase (APT) family kinase protein
MARRDRPALAAIVDWELTTVGDPMLDLGWLLATWPGDDGSVVGSATIPARDLPRPAELIARYGERSARDVSYAPWYEVLACYKLGIILEGTYARACAGMAPRATGDQLHTSTLGLFARAQARIAAS